MAWRRAEYKIVRKQMKPGDVIAFGGKGHFSEIIKWTTRGPVSHVGVILQSRLLIAEIFTKYRMTASDEGDPGGAFRLSLNVGRATKA